VQSGQLDYKDPPERRARQARQVTLAQQDRRVYRELPEQPVHRGLRALWAIRELWGREG
jgi:hypothetical protein